MVTRQQVDAVLTRFQRLLLDDGLWLELVDVSGGCVTIRLTGFEICAGASMNFQTGLEELLRTEVPGFDRLQLIVTVGA